jgi:hypothetical protein
MDWIYAAGWDRNDTSGYNDYCAPYTYDLEEDGIRFTGSGNQNSAKALSFQVEMDVSKSPPEKTLGGRMVFSDESTGARNVSGIFTGEIDSVVSDGHVNRNIRLLTQFIQNVNPTIELLGYARPNAGTYDGGKQITSGMFKLYWRVVGCANSIAGFGFQLDVGERYAYEDITRSDFLCFHEGDQHQRIRRSTVFMTTIERDADEVTLQALTDLDFAFLPSVKKDMIRPLEITQPKSKISTSRKSAIKLEVSIDELVSGAAPALDFTGDDVTQFATINGLDLLELPRF